MASEETVYVIAVQPVTPHTEQIPGMAGRASGRVEVAARTLLFERDPSHPGGQACIVNDERVWHVGPTQRVRELLINNVLRYATEQEIAAQQAKDQAPLEQVACAQERKEARLQKLREA